MRDFASSNQRGVRPMPARVVGVVTRGTSFALVALAARSRGAARFYAGRRPSFRRCRILPLPARCRAVSRSAQLPSRIFCSFERVSRRMGKQRKTVDLLDFAHHRQHCLHRQRARFDKISLHQRQIFPMDTPRRAPIVVQRGPRHRRHLVRNFVGHDRNRRRRRPARSRAE